MDTNPSLFSAQAPPGSDRHPPLGPCAAVLLDRWLEEDALPALIRSHTCTTPGGTTEAQPLCERLSAYLLCGDAASFTTEVDHWVASAMPIQTLLLDVLSPVAQQLGLWWEQDRMSFGEVTWAMDHLQSALRRHGHRHRPLEAMPRRPLGPSILLMNAPGEQHSFGVCVVAELFHEAGWDVSTQIGEPTDLIDPWCRHGFDVLGFSIATAVALPALRQAIARARELSLNTGIFIMVGGPLTYLDPSACATLRADAVLTSGANAPMIALQGLERASLPA